MQSRARKDTPQQTHVILIRYHGGLCERVMMMMMVVVVVVVMVVVVVVVVVVVC